MDEIRTTEIYFVLGDGNTTTFKLPKEDNIDIKQKYINGIQNKQLYLIKDEMFNEYIIKPMMIRKADGKQYLLIPYKGNRSDNIKKKAILFLFKEMASHINKVLGNLNIHVPNDGNTDDKFMQVLYMFKKEYEGRSGCVVNMV